MTALLATAALFLSMHEARVAIVHLETARAPAGAHVWADSCHRRRRDQVACIAHVNVTEPGRIRRERVRDVVTRDGAEHWRVHQAEPASFEELRVL